MITLSNDHPLKYVVASGALAFNGKGWPHEQLLRWFGLLKPSLFTIVIKTLTREPREGNFRWYWPWKCIRLISDGVVNAVGLTNKGIDWWLDEVSPHIDSKKIPLVGSILSDNVDELVLMAKMLNGSDLRALEINASCPNTEGDLLINSQKIIDQCQAVKDVSRFPIILKLSVVHDVRLILLHLRGIVEAVSINSVPWDVINPYEKSPLAHLGGGGVSGKAAQVYTWAMVKNIVALETGIPVIGPGVWKYDDIQKLRGIGAKAVSFGSVFLRYPWRPTLFVKKDMKET